MQLLRLVRNGLQHFENRALRVGLHVLRHLRSRKPQRLERGGLILAHGAALDQSRREVLQGRCRNLRPGPGGQEGRTEGGDLRLGKPGGHGDGPNALDDFAQMGRGGIHIVRQMVDGIGERVDLRKRQVHARPPVRHHLPGLIAGKVKGHAHLGGLLGEFGQILFRNPGLGGSRDDGGDAVGGHRDAPRHVHNRAGHGSQLGIRLKIDHLGDIRHRGLKGQRLCRGHAERTHNQPRRQRDRSHRQGEIAHAPTKARRIEAEGFHRPLHPAEGIRNQVDQRERRKNRKDFHHFTALLP